MKTRSMRLAALFLSATLAVGNLNGLSYVKAADIPGLNLLATAESEDGNLVTNPDFNDGTSGWTITGGGGTATNNGYPKGDTHYFLNGNAYMEQEITVPYAGKYKASTWVSIGGNNGAFGVKDAKTGEVIASVDLASQSAYKQYELEFNLKKGDSILVYLQGASGWTNGDKFSVAFDGVRFGNVLMNSDFASDEAWTATNALVGEGSAVLDTADSKIEQSFIIPEDGPYIAEVEFESAENAVVSLGTEQSAPVNGAKKVQVQLADCKANDEILVAVSGKAVVKSVTVKFDLEAMDNTLPVASGVVLNHEAQVGEVLKGTYTFEDADGHAEGTSEYKWYVSDSVDGDYTEISGAEKKNFEITEAYLGKYIKFEVTPVDEYLGKGAAVQSAPIGPVFKNVVPNPGFENGTGKWKDMKAEKVDAFSGSYRGTVANGKVGYQSVTIPESGYYDFSACVNGTGVIGVRDQAGKVLGEVSVNSDAEYKKYSTSIELALEEGVEVQVYFQQDNKEQPLYVDNVVLNVRGDKEAPEAFANIKKFTTTPAALETGISIKDKTVEVQYYYEMDRSEITVNEFEISDGATATVKAGDTLDFTNEFEITVTDKSGNEEIWTVKPTEAEKKVVVHSSNQYLEDTFNWAAQKQRQFVMTGKHGYVNKDERRPTGTGEADYIPSYWAGYYDRTAFYTRDFVHQATGGQIAGLEEENYTMFNTFAKECTEARKYYTVWALNFDGTPHTIDYNNDNSFVREVPAQFELVEKAYKQYLWSGDKRYISDEMFEFYTNVMTKYIDLHDANENGVAQEVGTGIFQGSCTYNERGRRVIEAGDAIGSQYQATLAYAGILKARGDEAAAEEWYQKAAELKKYFNEEWSVSDDMDSEYVCAWGPNGEKYSDFSKETSWFMPMKMITEPGEKNDAYIDFILENLGDGIGSTPTAPSNLEAYTYIPDMLFLYNRSDDAWKWMKYITSIKDEPHERPSQGTNGDYPEISFTFVSHTIEGMMGVEPDARRDFVATAPRLPKEVPDVTANHIDIGDSELSLTHVGNDSSSLTNVSGNDLTWEARFYGEFDEIKIDGKAVKAEQKEINGETVSYVTTTVKTGETVNAEAVVTVSNLEELIEEAKSLVEEKYNPEDWKNLQKEIAKAQVALDKDNSTVEDVKTAYAELKATMSAMRKAAKSSENDPSRDLPLEGMVATAGSEETESDDNPVEKAFDNKYNTMWHTAWSKVPMEDRWVEIALPEATTVGGVRILSRSGGGNGTIEKAEIWVKTAGSEEYVKVVEDAEFGVGWQTVTFDQIENVTNVKIQPTQTVGDFASAAEIRIMGEEIPDVPVDPEGPTVDKTDLQAAVDSAKALNKADYTASSWAVFETKLAAAEAVLADKEATDYEVLLAAANLKEAVKALVAVDKADLADLIEYAKSQQETDDYKYVVPAVKEAFEKALAEAVAVNDNADAVQSEVDAAYDALLEKVHYLGFVGNSKSLKVLVDAAKGLNEKLYTSATWKVLADALTKAEAVLADENAFQPEIDAAHDALQKAMDGLVKIKVDKSKLQKLVDKSQKYEDAIAEYTPATAELFLGALANAREVLAKEDAVQEEIDAAYTALQNAIFGLRLIPNKDKLEDLINKAEKVDTSKYTEESAAVFEDALAFAKAVFADENATEEDVKAAEKQLKKAQKNLVAKADGNNGNGNNKDKNTDKTPTTGDSTSVWMTIVLFAAALATTVLGFRRKRR